VAFLFLPRTYEKGEVLFRKGDEFQEILLQTDGELLATLQSDPPIERYFSKGYFLGDYEVIFNKRCQLTYTTTSQVKFLALPKHKFLKILSKYPDIQQEMKVNTNGLHNLQKNRFVILNYSSAID
jgi:CRP-like cAMP-binding protein